VRGLLSCLRKNLGFRFRIVRKVVLLGLAVTAAVCGVFGCGGKSFDFLGEAGRGAAITVLQGKSEGYSDGTLLIVPAATSSQIAFTIGPLGLCAEWWPIVDLGVDFGDISRHEVCVQWVREGEQFDDSRKACGVFNLKYLFGERVRQRLTLNLAFHGAWKGRIRALKFTLGNVHRPVGVDFVRFPNCTLLSLFMPHRRWLGLNKRVFLAYLPLGFVLLLAGANLVSALGRKRSTSGWEPAAPWAAITSKVLFVGVCIVFALNALFPFDFFPYLKFPLGECYVLYPEVLLGLLVVLAASAMGPALARLSAAEWAFWGFIAMAILSLKNARFLQASTVRLVYYLAPPVLFMLVGRGIFRAEHTSRLSLSRCFSIVVLTVGFLVGAEGVIEGIFNHNFLLDTFYRAFAPEYVEYTLGLPVASSFTDPSVLGSFLVMCFPVALFFAVYERENRRLRFFAMASVAVLGACLVLACSYGSAVAFAVSMGVYFLRRYKRLLLAVAIVGAVGLGVAAVAIAPEYQRYLREVKTVDRLVKEKKMTPTQIVQLAGEKLDHTLLYSVNQRIDGAANALRMVRDHPLCGVGIGNFEPLFNEYYDKAHITLRIYPVPDNVLFMIVAETGLLGLGAFGLFVLVVFLAIRRALAATRGDRYWNSYVWAVSVGVIGFGVNLLAYDGLFWFSPSFAFWAFLGMFLPLGLGLARES